MTKFPSNLKNQLSLQGFTIKPAELSMTLESTFAYVNLAIKFCKKMEEDVKAGKYSRRVTINGYIAKEALNVIRGGREQIAETLSFFVNMMTFRHQNAEIDLYAFLCDIDAPFKLIEIHNAIVTQFSLEDREFMDNETKNLGSFKYPFSKVIDIVGCTITAKSLDIFVEQVENDPRTEHGGIRDKMVPAVIAIENAIKSVWENVSTRRKKKDEGPKEMFELNMPQSDYIVRGQSPPRKKVSEAEGLLQEEDETDEDPYDLEDEEDDSEEAAAQGGEDIKDLVSIAHRYVFGNAGKLDTLRQEVKASEEEAHLSEKELLQKQIKELELKKEAARKKREEYFQLYQSVLGVFNQAKYNYVQLGKEIGYVQSLCSFFQREFKGDPAVLQRLKDISKDEIPEMKKLKLVIGKVFEKGSNDIYLGNRQVYKFAIDKEDYDNDIDTRNKDSQIFDLLNRPPPVPDQMGLKKARIKLREFQHRDKIPLSSTEDDGSAINDAEYLRGILLNLKRQYYTEIRRPKKKMPTPKAQPAPPAPKPQRVIMAPMMVQPEFQETYGSRQRKSVSPVNMRGSGPILSPKKKKKKK